MMNVSARRRPNKLRRCRRHLGNFGLASSLQLAIWHWESEWECYWACDCLSVVPTLCNRGSQLFDLGPPPASWANESDLHQVEILPLTAHMGGHAGMQNTAQEHRFTRSLAKSPEVPGQCVFSLLYIISGSPHGVLASMGSLPRTGAKPIW